ncbi:ankyrin repeat domain-containing protein [Acidiphilium sp. C61]|jgi:hypothetical protein|uniref:ankyrin repeat domain-containing protein n=1 Tax=Acidiphilium sp. C61 TaxID=1671485 RepID=UPI00157B4E97|nr:ankyrin repeat domain-containing protein [Acidiphilium sp. C61]
MTFRSKLRCLGLATLLGSIISIVPANAQMAGAGPGNGLGPIGGIPQPRHEAPTEAPPGLPGASSAGNISAGPVTDAGGDPTTLLFKAINHGDYAQARAAVSRGANLAARNALGETPIELSVELNRNRITFMLLSARAEEVPASTIATGPSFAQPATKAPTRSKVHGIPKSSMMVKAAGRPAYPAGQVAHDAGRPDPNAGFLGFGHGD